MNYSKTEISPTTSFFIDFIGIVVVFIVLKELGEIFIPLVIAYFLYFVFSPLNQYLEKKKVPVYMNVLINILIIIFLFGGIISIIVESFSQFGEQLPLYEVKINNIVSANAAAMGVQDSTITNFQISEWSQKLDIGIIAGSVFTSTFSLIGTTFFVIFFFIFVVTGHHNIYESIKRRYVEYKALPVISPVSPVKKSIDQKKELVVEKADVPEGIDAVQNTFQEITNQVQKYIITKFLMSLLMGLMVGIVLTFAGVDFPVVWAVLTFLFHFIPNIGSIVAVLLPCVMALIQFESIGYALFLAVLLIGIQNIIGNFVEPRLFGERMGLNPLVVLLSLLLWGYIWGIVGMLLSVPLTAVSKIMISKSESKHLKFISDIMS